MHPSRQCLPGAYIDYSFYIDHENKSLMDIFDAINFLSKRRVEFQGGSATAAPA